MRTHGDTDTDTDTGAGAARKRNRVAGITALVLVLGLFGTLLGPSAWYFLFEYGCRDREDRLAKVLATDPLLDAGPAGTAGPRAYTGCDDDDLWVYAGNRYAYARTEANAAAHYREAAPANGWRPTSRKGCFTKKIGSSTAYFTVDGVADGELEVSIVANHEDVEWC
ncbi:hypothetical protein [Streptomyces yaizuensis]|uniref:Secreted protein n=1 Tax=Streptomyces yaizuensis TaxID=2989713 RepID=A0ABQ5NZU1_9ACTN|nr:hypothetical protein [Streptomyces sp. YSPA8]GLF95876.1 hypothetical protein SYYSPA8_16285 [Streptomyces sp. YSPA8]